jgi:hypothetical protein
LSIASVSARGERPLAFNPCSVPDFVSHTMANKSPPTPQLIGSTRPSIAFAAIAASTADPPALRMSRAACVANG